MERRFILHQIIDTPTRIHNKCKSLIDMFFTNIDNIMFSGTIDVSISDHLPIYIIIKKCRKPKNVTRIKGRGFKNYDPKQFQATIIADPQWKFFWLDQDVNMKWSILHEIITRSADLYCPLAPMKFNLDNEGWFTKEVLEAISEKKRLYKKANRDNPKAFWRKLNGII